MTIDFRFYFSLFLRRLPYFLLILAVFSAAGFTLAAVLPPVYRAQAVLIVESQQIPSDLAETTVQTGMTEQLQIIQQRILTRASLLEMANRLRIYETAEAAGQRLTADEIVDDLRSRIAIVTTGGDSSRGPAQATVVRVSFPAPTAQMSSVVTNEIVTLILQENVAIRTSVAGQTLDYFTEEVSRLDRELSASGAAILSFQEANLQALPDSLDFRRSQQSAGQERLVTLTREEATLSDRRDRLVTLFETTGQVAPIEQSALSPEERQLQGLRDELNSALVVLSPQNPRIRMLEAQISGLEARIAQQSGAVSADGAAATQLSAYEIQLADIDGQLAYNREQQRLLRVDMTELQASIEATPGNAITLDTLQRDYANIRSQYDQAVTNRARAETGDTIEALAKGQRISVIEQAIPPTAPESPNRPILAIAGVVAGIVVGLAFVVLLEFLKNAIRRPIDITKKLGINPLGTLPMIRTQWEIVRRRAIIAAGFAIALIALPAVLWLVHTQVTPLDIILNRILSRLT